jgi:hypothetical protein
MLQPVSHIEEAMAPFVGMPANFPSITQTPQKVNMSKLEFCVRKIVEVEI